MTGIELAEALCVWEREASICFQSAPQLPLISSRRREVRNAPINDDEFTTHRHHNEKLIVSTGVGVRGCCVREQLQSARIQSRSAPSCKLPRGIQSQCNVAPLTTDLDSLGFVSFEGKNIPFLSRFQRNHQKKKKAAAHTKWNLESLKFVLSHKLCVFLSTGPCSFYVLRNGVRVSLSLLSVCLFYQEHQSKQSVSWIVQDTTNKRSRLRAQRLNRPFVVTFCEITQSWR